MCAHTKKKTKTAPEASAPQAPGGLRKKQKKKRRPRRRRRWERSAPEALDDGRAQQRRREKAYARIHTHIFKFTRVPELAPRLARGRPREPRVLVSCSLLFFVSLAPFSASLSPRWCLHNLAFLSREVRREARRAELPSAAGQELRQAAQRRAASQHNREYQSEPASAEAASAARAAAVAARASAARA